jgi:serine/threonine protein phosphatase PrpC
MTDRKLVPPIEPQDSFRGTLVRGASDVGSVREENQDYMGWFTNGDRQLLVVCDGMGGHSGGYEASRIAVKALGQVFEDSSAADPPIALLRRALQTANRKVFEEAARKTRLRGMGSTAVVALVEEDRAWIAHVGDSRAYLIRRGQAERLTRDHTQVNRLVAAGLIPEDEADHHPLGHILDRSIGSSASVDVEVRPEPIELAPHDRIMLCSDGYCGLVEDHEMGQQLEAGVELTEALQQGIDLALSRGGPDNITIATLELLGQGRAPAARPREPRPQAARRETGDLLGLALVFLLTLGALAWVVTV